MFQLTKDEIPENFSKSQIATLNENGDRRGTNIKKLPFAFTEQGIYMLATVLRGELAEQQSIFIMRAFREMRHYIKQNQQFVTQSEMRLVTAKVSEISVQVAGVVDWKNKAEDRFDSIQRSIDTLNENFVSDKDFKNFVIYWEAARRTPPEYIPRLIAYQLKYEELVKNSAKRVEFEGVKNKAGANDFTMSPKKWIESTNAIGIISKSGRYGGTFAHSDIAFEFAS